MKQPSNVYSLEAHREKLKAEGRFEYVVANYWQNHMKFKMSQFEENIKKQRESSNQRIKQNHKL